MISGRRLPGKPRLQKRWQPKCYNKLSPIGNVFLLIKWGWTDRIFIDLFPFHPVVFLKSEVSYEQACVPPDHRRQYSPSGFWFRCPDHRLLRLQPATDAGSKPPPRCGGGSCFILIAGDRFIYSLAGNWLNERMKLCHRSTRWITAVKIPCWMYS